jgi:hypothetical protein
VLDDGDVVSQVLCRDDGVLLGLIVRYGDGPTYAWWRRAYGNNMRVGACSSDYAARAAVEHALGEGR